MIVKKLWLVFLLIAACFFDVGRCSAKEDIANPCESTGDIVRSIHGGDSVGWYQARKAEGYTDTQIRDGFIWWIKQPNTNPSKKHGWAADNAAAIGMYLFKNDTLLEKAILEAQQNPQLYEAGANFGGAVAINGSPQLIDDFRKIGFDVPSFNEIVAQRQQREKGSVSSHTPTTILRLAGLVSVVVGTGIILFKRISRRL